MKSIEGFLDGIVPERGDAASDGDAPLTWADVLVVDSAANGRTQSQRGGGARWTHRRCPACRGGERDTRTGKTCACVPVVRTAWRLTLARIPYELAHHGCAEGTRFDDGRSYAHAEGPGYLSEAANAWCDTWARGAKGPRLVGNTGAYKSSRACASTQRLIMRGVSARFVAWSAWLADYRDAIGRDADQHAARARITEPEVVWLDDIGREHATDWTREQLSLVLQERLDGKRTVALTTNLDDAALADYLGDRLWSRVRGATSVAHVVGTDGRR